MPERNDEGATPGPTVTVLESVRQRWTRLLPIPFALASAFAALVAFVHPVVLASAPLAVIGAVLAMVALAKRPRRRLAQGEARLDAGGLHVGARLAVPAARLRDALLIPSSPEGTLVRVGAGLGATDLSVASPEEGRALLRRAGLDASRTAARLRARAPSVAHYRTRAGLALSAVLVMPLAIALGLLGGPALAVPLLAALLYAPLLVSLAIPARVTVGTDGVLLEWLWQRRFVALDDVVDAQAEDGAVVMNTTLRLVRLRHADGSVKEELLVDAKQEGPLNGSLNAQIDARAEALAERVREAIAARREASAAAELGSLARARRPIDAWLAHLRGLLARTETFRGEAPPTREALLRLVEDSRALASLRAAAAVALAARATGGGGDEEGDSARVRLRAAADASAAPRLRVALRAAAEQDDAALAAAMEELEQREAAVAAEIGGDRAAKGRREA